jgi:hypothetical protein
MSTALAHFGWGVACTIASSRPAERSRFNWKQALRLHGATREEMPPLAAGGSILCAGRPADQEPRSAQL